MLRLGAGLPLGCCSASVRRSAGRHRALPVGCRWWQLAATPRRGQLDEHMQPAHGGLCARVAAVALTCWGDEAAGGGLTQQLMHVQGSAPCTQWCPSGGVPCTRWRHSGGVQGTRWRHSLVGLGRPWSRLPAVAITTSFFVRVMDADLCGMKGTCLAC